MNLVLTGVERVGSETVPKGRASVGSPSFIAPTSSPDGGASAASVTPSRYSIWRRSASARTPRKGAPRLDHADAGRVDAVEKVNVPPLEVPDHPAHRDLGGPLG